jgi:hypothetical protein
MSAHISTHIFTCTCYFAFCGIINFCILKLSIKTERKLGMAVTWKTEALGLGVQGQSGQCSKTLSQNKKGVERFHGTRYNSHWNRFWSRVWESVGEKLLIGNTRVKVILTRLTQNYCWRQARGFNTKGGQIQGYNISYKTHLAGFLFTLNSIRPRCSLVDPEGSEEPDWHSAIDLWLFCIQCTSVETRYRRGIHEKYHEVT